MKTKLPSLSNKKSKSPEQKYPDSNPLLSTIIESPKDIVIFALGRNYCYTAFNNDHEQTIKKIWGADIEIGMNMLEIIKDPRDREKITAAGCDDYLAKLVNQEGILKKLKEWLAKEGIFQMYIGD